LSSGAVGRKPDLQWKSTYLRVHLQPGLPQLRQYLRGKWEHRPELVREQLHGLPSPGQWFGRLQWDKLHYLLQFRISFVRQSLHRK
jgi:hypothetical protein